MPIKDLFGRPVENLRISVTQRCNFKCIYCHREGQMPNYEVEMSAEEIEKVVKVAASLGVYGVKLTGGEPLLRNDIVDIVHRISGVSGIKDVSMTTNGFFLTEYAWQLKEAGLSRINVSMDTLRLERFRMITNMDVDAHRRIIDGIIEAAKAGLSPIKINMVLLRGINDDEIEGMINFVRDNGLILQVIELENMGDEKLYGRYYVNLNSVGKKLEENAINIIVRRMHHRRKYILKDGAEVEIVKPMHNAEFCRNCNRIRLTSDGMLKPCLFRNDNLINILNPIRRGVDNEQLKNLFIEAVSRREPFFK